jgi:KDO2-lipid IV(A) lauroyltransferase
VRPRWLLEAAGLALGSALAARLPLASAQALLAAGARRAFTRGSQRQGWTMTNLRIAFPDAPEESLRAIGAESYVHTAWNAYDLLRAERWDAAQFVRRFDFRGLEHVEQALAAGRGAFLLTPHLGNFDLAGRALCARGFQLSAVARIPRNPYLRRRLSKQRERLGIEPIDHRRALAAIMRALRQGRLVGILLDQYSRRTQGVFVPLFGKRCSTSAGLALLALRSGAPIVHGYVVRDAPDHHLVTLDPPIDAPSSGDRQADVTELTARCNRAMEAAIRKHPEQWMWAHRRFRHSPDLPDDLY